MDLHLRPHYDNKRRAHWIGYFVVSNIPYERLSHQDIADDFHDYLTYLKRGFMQSPCYDFVEDIVAIVNIDENDPEQYSIVPSMAIALCCQKRKLGYNDFQDGMAWIRDDLALVPMRHRLDWDIHYTEHDSETIDYRQGIDRIVSHGRANRVHTGCQFDFSVTGIWKR